MKDFESVYDKICLKFKERVDLVKSEYKVAKKEAFKKASFFLIGGIVIAIVVYFYFKFISIWPILIVTLMVTLAVFGICLDKISKSSPTLDGSILVEIYNAFLEELPPEARYIKDRGFDEQVYKMGNFEKYNHLSSNTSIEGKLKDGTNFKTSYVSVSRGHGDNIQYTYRGYITDIDLNKNFNQKFMIDRNGISPIEDGNDIKLNVAESFVNSIIEILNKYKNEKNIVADVTIVDNKLLVRVMAIYSEWLTIDNPLSKQKLEAFYNDFYKIFELLEEIVNKIKE